MLVIAFIVVFIVGAITGVVAYTIWSLHIANLTVEEASQCGNMLILATSQTVMVR